MQNPALQRPVKLSQQQLAKARRARTTAKEKAVMELARLMRHAKRMAYYASRTWAKPPRTSPRRKPRQVKQVTKPVLRWLQQPVDFLAKARAIRAGIQQRVKTAVGGYTGTVVARLEPDVKRLQTPSTGGAMENKEQQDEQNPGWSMDALLRSKNLVCHMFHSDSAGNNTAEGDEYVVLLAAGLQRDGQLVACNQNLPNSMFSDDQLGRAYRNSAENPGGVNTKLLDLGGAIGFRSAQLYTLSKSFMAAAVTNFRYAPKGLVPVQAIFASLVDHKPDWVEGNVPDGTVKEVRAAIKDCLLTGTSAVFADHGFTIDARKSISEVLAQPGMHDPATNEDTGRHFFIVVGRVWQRSNKPHETMRGMSKAQHWRFYCSELAVLHIDPARIDSGELFGTTVDTVLHKQLTMPQCLKLEAFASAPANKPAAVTTTTEPAVVATTAEPVVVPSKEVELDAEILEELISYRKAFGIKAESTFRIDPVSIAADFDTVFNRQRAKEVAAVLRTQQNSAAAQTADAVRWAIINFLCDGDIANAEGDDPFEALNISAREWQVADVLSLFAVLQQVGTKKGLADLPTVVTEDDKHTITFGKNGVVFVIDNGLVYKGSCMLLNSLEMVVRAPKDQEEKYELEGLVHSSSLAGLVKLLYYGYLPLLTQSYSSVMTNTAANFVEFCKAEFVEQHLAKFSSHEIKGQNSGVLMRVERTLDLLIHYRFNPFKGLRWVDLTAQGRFAANLVSHYTEQAPKFDSREVRKQAIELAFRQGYYDLVFNKQQLVDGYLGHINMAALEQGAPKLFQLVAAKYGISNSDVICLTLKATKGLKRVMLSLARAADVLNQVEAGYKHFDQEAPTAGALIKVAIAPTVTYTAGNSLWIGNEADMPVAAVNKKVGPYYVLDFPAEAKPEFGMGTVLKEGAYTVSQQDEWTVYTPNQEVWLEPNSILCTVPKNAGGVSFVKHEATQRGVLKCLRYRMKHLLLAEQQDMEFVWEYTIFEHYPKVRSIAKAMVNRASKELVYNKRNDLTDVQVDLVHFQDGIKADTLYAWLTIIGTTLKYNKTCPELAAMRAMAKAINTELGQPDFDGLVIENIFVVLGKYDKLQAAFKELFAKPVWYRFAEAGAMGRALHTMHQTMSDTYDIANEGPNYRTFVPAGASYDDPATNVTQFVFDNEGNIAEVWQRGMSFIGRPGCPLYTIELFEATTVQENVTRSWQLPVNVTSATWFCNNGANPAALEALRKNSIDDLVPNILRAKALAAMSMGMVPKGTSAITVNFAGGRGKGTYHLANEDRELLVNLIKELNLTVSNSDPNKNYKAIAKALADYTFTFEVRGRKTSIYMPVLYNLNKLQRIVGSTQTLSGLFYEYMLRPLVSGKGVDLIVAQMIRGKLDALVKSAETPKLLKGRDKQTGRRIGMPNVPVEETWILYSEEPGSMYMECKQYLRKFGIDLTIGTNENVIGFNDRAPIASGWFSKLRVVTEEENEANYYKLGSHHFAVNPLAVYVDGGDCDGDNHNFAYSGGAELEGELLTYDLVMQIRNDGMGADMLTTGSYFYDHFTRKSWSSAVKTLSSACVKTAVRSHEEYIKYNIGAHVVQWESVGAGYKYYMLGEHLIDVARAYKKAGIACEQLKFLQHEDAYKLVSATAEIYEVMLGGYSPAAERLYQDYLAPAIKQGKLFDLSSTKVEHFAALLEDYGANSTLALELLRLLNLVALTQSLETQGVLPVNVTADTNYAFAISAALFCFEIGRGRFKGFKQCFGTYNETKEAARGHRAAMEYAYNMMHEWLVNNGAGIAVVMDQSRVFSSLRVLFRHLSFELSLTPAMSWHPDFFKYFNGDDDQGKGDNGSGGSKVPPTKPAGPAPTQQEDNKAQHEDTVQQLSQKRTKTMQVQTAPEQKQVTNTGLTQDQERAFKYALEGHNMVISGEAGTGKSYLLQHIREHFTKEGWKVVVTGSTGTSVMNVEGDGTFNSKLGLFLGFTGRHPSGIEADKIIATSHTTEAKEITLALSSAHKGLLFIVDEISMVDTKLLAVASKIVRDSGVKCQWILFGDPGQCTPVKGELFFKDFVLEYGGNEKVQYQSFIKSGKFTCVGLKEVVRQANDKEFLSDLQQLRAAKGIGKTIIERFKASLTEKPAQAIHAYFNNECVMEHNARETERMLQEGKASRVYKAFVHVKNPSNRERFLKHFSPIEPEMTLCIDMPVMVRKNTKDPADGTLLAANGTVGIVKELGESYIVIQLRNGSLVQINVEELDGPKLSNGKKMGMFKQLPVHPAFALTGHKLQGLTITEPLVVHPYQKVRGRKVPVNTTGWLYVACSRVTKADHLYFDVDHINDIAFVTNSMKADAEALEWMETLS